MSYHQPDLQTASIVGEGDERVVEPYKVIKWQIGTKYKLCHTIGEDGPEGKSPCYCGQYFVRWACTHWIKQAVRCGQKLSPVTGNPVICFHKAPEIVIDNLSSFEECDNCTALTRDAYAVFDKLDQEEAKRPLEGESDPSPSCGQLSNQGK